MATGKYSRVDGRKSSCQCSTVTTVMVVSFCLVGVWLLMSSSIFQVQNSNMATPEPTEKVNNNNNNDVVKKSDDTNKPFEDVPTETVGTESEDKKQDNSSSETKVESNNEKDSDSNSNSNSNSNDKKEKEKEKANEASSEVFTDPKAELLKESKVEKGVWPTQSVESENEKKSKQAALSKDGTEVVWKLCNTTAGPDYIPCLDNLDTIRKLPTNSHYEHRERHCPVEPPTCLVPLPEGYRSSIKWPKSREKIWYYNVPHTQLAVVKGHQNWVKVTGEYLTFPGGGTQFIHGALRYIDFIQQALPNIAWGNRSRAILDVGCGVASFGGFLFERDVLAMSFAPKDEHEAQVQFALERGIPAFLSVMGTKRLPFPSNVFDAIHCARCRVPWHIEGGKLLLELNRVLRPGGYFVWSATPVYQTNPEDSGIWKEMSELTKAMCWELVVIRKDKLNGVAAAIYRKPSSNECYNGRPQNEPPLCEESDDPNAAWNVPLQACMHKVPEDSSKRGAQWPEAWPRRLETPPYWLNSQVGVYGKSGPEDFGADYELWKKIVEQSYLTGMGINWSTVRNVMDMRAVYGGFAAALKDLKLWVMNVVPIESPDTLPIIFERGLIGMYHDWCESFNTYPRSYDLLHADHLFSGLSKRCNIKAVLVEVDRVLRPEGVLIMRDNIETINEVEKLAKSMKWEVQMTYTKDNEGLLCVRKAYWRPNEAVTLQYAIA